MPTDQLLASALLGTSRRPLAAADRTRARGLLPGRAVESRLALALAAAESLTARSALPLSTAPPRPADEPDPPPRPPCPQDDVLDAYLSATQLLCEKPDTRYFSTRALTAPPHSLTRLLAAALGGRGEVHYSAFSALGRRGLWLARLHPRYRSRVAFLDKPQPPRATWQRIAHAAVHIERAGQRDAGPASSGPIALALRRGELHLALGWTSAIQLVLGDREPSAVELDVLRRVTGADDWPARAADLHNRRARARANSVSAGGGRFAVEAEVAVALGESSSAEALLEEALLGDDLLAARHPALPALVRQLDAATFARFIDEARVHFRQGWRDPGLRRLLEASPHPVGQTASEEWVADAVLGHGAVVQSLAVQYPHRLHVAAAGRAAELVRELPDSGEAAALLAILLARQRLDARFPVVTAP